MNSNLVALQALVAVLAEAVKDGEAALAPGQSALSRVLDFESVVPKVVALLPQLSGLSLAGLKPSDWVSLAENLVAALGIDNAHAKAVVDAACQLVNDAVGVMLPDVQALVAAIKQAPAQASVQAAAAAQEA